MTHISEADFQDRVESILVEFYGPERVTPEYVFDTGRRADFLVDAGLTTLAIEVENDAASVVEGVGQAILYANHDPSRLSTPLVVVPDGHAPDGRERSHLSQSVPVVEECNLRRLLSSETTPSIHE